MLIKCPECKLQISDKALMCPHCGYPMTPQAKNISRPRSKRKRLPNGFGQISEIKGRNLRKPFRAMVTVGKTETGHSISKPLKPVAYFETYNEAYEALIAFNRNPYVLEESITVNELFKKWYAEKERASAAKATLNNYKWTWGHCKPVYDMEFRSVSISTIKKLMTDTNSDWMKKAIKNIFNSLFDYAVENEIVERNIARSFSSHVKHQESDIHTNYTDEELKMLWENVDVKDVDLILIQCYTGLRPGEVGGIRLSAFDRDSMTAIGGSKTESGKNRQIVFHTKICELVERRYQEAVACGSEWLFSNDGQQITYKDFYAICNRINKTILNATHKAHDGRVTFVTMAKKAGVDEYVVKKLMGHHIDDITERVYTKRDVGWLREELEKIK